MHPLRVSTGSNLSRLVITIGLRDRLQMLEERQERHRDVVDADEMARQQLVAFNSVWRLARRRYRFYADWQKRHGLDDEITDLEELRRFPILRKEHIAEHFGLIAEDSRPCGFIGTGGSEGPSMSFPRGPEDAAFLHSNMYLGRSWAGISPGDNIVLIWGHEHLHGLGLRGRINKAKRHLMDRLIGTERLNVYRLDHESVAAYFERIAARPGAVVVGYVSAIRKLLDFVERTGVDGRGAGIRAVIFCSETVFPRDLERARSLLGTVPLIEYGMGETGVMAYSTPQSSILTFLWDAFHCHVTDSSELIVTTLQPFRLPLINYGTGDRVEISRDAQLLPFRCTRIVGRTRTVLGLPLRDGRMIDVHSELIEDCLDLVPEVRSYFVHQKADTIDIAVRAAGATDLPAIRRRFLDVIARHNADLDDARVTFSHLKTEPMTVAGKRRYVLRD